MQCQVRADSQVAVGREGRAQRDVEIEQQRQQQARSRPAQTGQARTPVPAFAPDIPAKEEQRRRQEDHRAMMRQAETVDQGRGKQSGFGRAPLRYPFGPGERAEQNCHQEQGIQRVDFGHDCLRPERGRKGKGQGCQCAQPGSDQPGGWPGRTHFGQVEDPPGQWDDQRHGQGATGGREDVDPPGRVVERQQVAPQVGEYQIERIAGRVNETAEPGRKLELAAVAAKHTRRERAEVDDKREDATKQSQPQAHPPVIGRGLCACPSVPAHGPSSTQSTAAASVRKSPATRRKASVGAMISAAVPGAAPCTPTRACAWPARSERRPRATPARAQAAMRPASGGRRRRPWSPARRSGRLEAAASRPPDGRPRSCWPRVSKPCRSSTRPLGGSMTTTL